MIFLFNFIALGAFGILLIFLAYLLIVKKKVNLIHSYQLRGVKDIKNYCTAMGLCILFLGGVFLFFSLLGLLKIMTFNNMEFTIVSLCLLDVLGILFVQKKFSGRII